MLHRSKNQLTAIFLAAAMLLANLAGGLLHDHPHAPQGASGCRLGACQHTHGHAAVTQAERLASDGLASGWRATNVRAAHPDDCTVCRTLGQRVHSPKAASVDGVQAPTAELKIAAVTVPVSSLASSARPRAPPLGG